MALLVESGYILPNDMKKALALSIKTYEIERKERENIRTAIKLSEETLRKKLENLYEKAKTSSSDNVDLAMQISLVQYEVDNLNSMKQKPISETLATFNTTLESAIKSVGSKQIISNSGRGDCMFMAVSDSLRVNYNINIHHSELRQRSVDYIVSYWDRFGSFAQTRDKEPFKTAQDFYDYMSHPGTWGDHLTLRALCEIYNMNALLVVQNNNVISQPIIIDVESDKTIMLKFTMECHYEAISR